MMDGVTFVTAYVASPFPYKSKNIISHTASRQTSHNFTVCCDKSVTLVEYDFIAFKFLWRRLDLAIRS